MELQELLGTIPYLEKIFTEIRKVTPVSVSYTIRHTISSNTLYTLKMKVDCEVFTNKHTALFSKWCDENDHVVSFEPMHEKINDHIYSYMIITLLR